MLLEGEWVRRDYGVLETKGRFGGEGESGEMSEAGDGQSGGHVLYGELGVVLTVSLGTQHPTLMMYGTVTDTTQ